MRDVLIVGGGVAGCAAGIYTARAGMDTLIVDGGESTLARNATLENYPGFPAGIDARLYLQMVRDHADHAGCAFRDGRVTRVELLDEDDRDAGFLVDVDADAAGGDGAGDATGDEAEANAVETLEADRLIASSWSDSEYLTPLDVGREQHGNTYVVRVDDCGRTAVEGVYAAGRVAGEPHQAIVAAGHGAKVGLALVQDSETPFYHDWVAPEGYFTGRDIEIPPACEEIDESERRDRNERAREMMLEYLADPVDEAPTMHPHVDQE